MKIAVWAFCVASILRVRCPKERFSNPILGDKSWLRFLSIRPPSVRYLHVCLFLLFIRHAIWFLMYRYGTFPLKVTWLLLICFQDKFFYSFSSVLVLIMMAVALYWGLEYKFVDYGSLLDSCLSILAQWCDPKGQSLRLMFEHSHTMMWP